MSFCSETRRHTARKQHPCTLCNAKIQPGDQYVSWAGVWEGDFGVVKLHEVCFIYTERHFKADDWESYEPGASSYEDIRREILTGPLTS